MLFTILRSLKNRGIFPFKQTDVEVFLLGFLGLFFCVCVRLFFFYLMLQLLFTKEIIDT